MKIVFNTNWSIFKKGDTIEVGGFDKPMQTSTAQHLIETGVASPIEKKVEKVELTECEEKDCFTTAELVSMLEEKTGKEVRLFKKRGVYENKQMISE